MKQTYEIQNLNYTYDNTRKGAKYTYLDSLTGEYKNGNAGDLFEIARKYTLGLHTHKDSNGAFDLGSDIEETGTSCKSWAFTLQGKIKADTFEAAKRVYFDHTASQTIEFGWVEGDELITYIMNHNEFEQFLNEFCKLERGVIRGPKFSVSKRREVEAWFEGLAS